MLQALPHRNEVFNPWKDYDEINDFSPDAPTIRASNLERYLSMRIGKAKLVLVAEAPGFRGCKFSGVAMTSERILLGKQPQVPADAVFGGLKLRTSKPTLIANGFIEPTASITWALLLSLGLAPGDFVLWNAFPCHPRKGEDPLTNRTPSPSDLAAFSYVLAALLSLFASARPVAVGRVAQRALATLGGAVADVRHPAMGGATKFRTQIQDLMASRSEQKLANLTTARD
jgi:hypothetical protein